MLRDFERLSVDYISARRYERTQNRQHAGQNQTHDEEAPFTNIDPVGIDFEVCNEHLHEEGWPIVGDRSKHGDEELKTKTPCVHGSKSISKSPCRAAWDISMKQSSRLGLHAREVNGCPKVLRQNWEVFDLNGGILLGQGKYPTCVSKDETFPE